MDFEKRKKEIKKENAKLRTIVNLSILFSGLIGFITYLKTKDIFMSIFLTFIIFTFLAFIVSFLLYRGDKNE